MGHLVRALLDELPDDPAALDQLADALAQPFCCPRRPRA